MKFLSDTEAICQILHEKDRYVCYMGAGVSAEAEVKTADEICNDIREELIGCANIPNIEFWANTTLNWNDPSRKYSTCIAKGRPNMAKRVAYFRKILQGKQPSFCHHAVALLMTNGYFKNTCLTTNFDKLLEIAFAQQGNWECQPIRSDDEAQYWENDKDKSYIIKLHGDYDTQNILNTFEETILISDTKRDMVKRFLQNAGMVVFGTAGNEKSIYTMFDYLSSDKVASDKVLSHGLLWGVYMGSSRPKNMNDDESKNLLEKRIKEEGVVSREILAMINRTSSKNELFCFFPVWGAGNFILNLIQKTEDSALIETAELYLDHKKRIRNVFNKRAGLSEDAISKHIASLKKRQDKISGDPQATEKVFEITSKPIPVKIAVHYGDITSRLLMTEKDFQSKRLAIISPDDTCISAGGGAAKLLLEKAGAYNILNEIAKFSPIEHCAVAVTSGGKLPVHYIFHAAALEIVEIGKNLQYSVSKEDVQKTMMAALNKASALEVEVLLVPLMGAGAASLQPKQSLEGILEAINSWASKKHKMNIIIVIYKEGELPRNIVHQCLKRKLHLRFSIIKL